MESRLGLLTVLVLSLTLYETYRSRLVNAKIAKISSLPFFTIKVKRDPNKDPYNLYLCNLVDKPAYDVKIESWKLLLLDMQVVWEINSEFSEAITGKCQVKIDTEHKEDGKPLGGGKELTMLHFLSSNTPIVVSFKDVLGDKYFVTLIPNKSGISDKHVFVVKHQPKKYTLRVKLITRFSRLVKEQIPYLYYKHFVWKLEVPGFKEANTKYHIFAVLKRRFARDTKGESEHGW